MANLPDLGKLVKENRLKEKAQAKNKLIGNCPNGCFPPMTLHATPLDIEVFAKSTIFSRCLVCGQAWVTDHENIVVLKGKFAIENKNGE